MRLLIHIGTEKTGSSYLQTICAINRKKLARHGIWFPYAGKREQDLIRGNASPGNAHLLNVKLQNHDFLGARQWLLSKFKESKKNTCHTLLLSNEILSLTLAEENVFSFFDGLTKELKFETVSYLLCIREPVDFALSLYKHRAKNGKIAEIEEWMNSSFYYNSSLRSFMNLSEKFSIHLKVSKYANEEGALEESFFRQWIGIDLALHKPTKRVNPSLSLSELAILRRLAKKDDSFTKTFYNAFLALPRAAKADDDALAKYYKYIIRKNLLQSRETWDMFNNHLSKEHRLKGLDEEIEVSEHSGEFLLSSDQIEAIANATVLAGQLNTKFIFAFHALKNRVFSLMKR